MVPHGSVFKIKFRVLDGDFESIETSPEFVQLGFKVIQTSTIRTILEKKLSIDKSLEVNVAISLKNLLHHSFTRKVTANKKSQN